MSNYLEYKQKLKQAPPIDHPYLDAILRCIMDLEDRIENDNVLMLGRMDIEKLIELVDRATPKKPINQIINYNGSKVGDCPNCKNLVIVDCYEYKEKFCRECGQALLWKD